MRRIVIFAPHYAEYAARLAMAVAAHADVLLILDRANRRNECDERLWAAVCDRVRVVEFGSVGRAARIAALAKVVVRIALFRPDFVNVQEEEGRLTAWIIRALRGRHRLLLTVHDPRPHTGVDAGYAQDNQAHQAAIRAAAEAFHVHGAFCRSQLVAQFGEARPILDTAHGVILVPREPEMRSPEPGRVLMFGRMEAYKGLEPLLDACEALWAEGVALTLVLAGRGPEIPRLRARIAALPHVEVIETFLSVAEAVAQFQRAALVVLPYRDATQSGVVAAAYANSRPVVASRTGGLVDSVREGSSGLLVPPGDHAALAAAIRRMLREPELAARLAAGAQKLAATDLAWSNIAEAMLAFMPPRR